MEMTRESILVDLVAQAEANVANLRVALDAYEDGRPVDLVWMVPDTGICFHRTTKPGALGGGGPLSADAVRLGDVAPRDGRGVYAEKVARDAAVRRHLADAERSLAMLQGLLRDAQSS